ncbi:hypothetical protein IV498_06130 [Paenarthrobacter sp. Z7-10]|uniref:hypothetical protein n=1 Tax=Paenarthrobacter sp. Z7-10 TaxID=2787635 RepID=UPI0022A9D53A|nr:hypothetical protein [Paenarthrobacter sp. Z7-10]MCZ2402774.1 hypothetical protein [Paenarthrobacter sp. Z7-10]
MTQGPERPNGGQDPQDELSADPVPGPDVSPPDPIAEPAVQPAPPTYSQPPSPSPWGQAPRWGQYAPPPGSVQGSQQPQQPGWPEQSGWPQKPGRPEQSGWPQPAAPGYQHYAPPPKPGVIPLRPLGLGEVLDGAFQAARRNGKAMFGSALLMQAFSAVVSLLLLAVVVGSGLPLLSLASGTVTDSQLSSFLVGSLSAVIVAVLLQTVTTMILQGVLVIPVARAVLNRGTGFSQMWSLARRRIASLIGLSLLYVLAVLLALTMVGLIGWGLVTAMGAGGAVITLLLLVALILGFVWVGAKLLVAPAALVIENIGIFRSIGRSWTLTTNNWWRTFGTAFLANLIVGVITGVIAVPVSFLANMVALLVNPHPTAQEQITQLLIVQAISTVISSLLGAVALAFQSGVLALIYLDLRMRKEGFDVVLMKEHEGGPGTDPAGIPGRAATVAPWKPASP